MGTKVNSNYEDLITFTRASKGHALRPVSYGDELVTNGTFDTDSDWTKASNWSIGSDVATSDGGSGILQQTATVLDPSKIYVFEFDVTSYTSGGVKIYSGAGSDPTDYVNAVGSYSYAFIPIGTTPSLFSNAFNGSVDNVSIKEVFFDQTDGTLTLFEHPDNVPRVEYDADGNRLGLLVEEARTTLVTSSEDFSGWSNINAPLEANSIEAPDGTVTATKLIANTENGQHRRDYPRTYSAGTYTFSVFAKVGGYNYLELRLAGDGVYVDIRDGSLAGASAGITTSYEDVGNGWKRIAITHSAGANDTARINVVETSGQRSFTGDGTSGIYIWGAQLEEGAFPTSYIKTTGSTATRSADVASIPVADFGYNQNEGTLFAEVVDYTSKPTGSNYVVSLDDNTASNRNQIIRYNNAWIYDVKVSNVTQVSQNLGTTNDPAKVAFAFKLNDFAATEDGDAVVTDTSGTVPNVTKMTIGSAYNNSAQLNGHIKSIKYYPRRLTNAQLQDLTS